MTQSPALNASNVSLPAVSPPEVGHVTWNLFWSQEATLPTGLCARHLARLWDSKRRAGPTFVTCALQHIPTRALLGASLTNGKLRE